MRRDGMTLRLECSYARMLDADARRGSASQSLLLSYLCVILKEIVHVLPRVAQLRTPGESGFETGKMHAIWPVLFDSGSWHLAIEGHARPWGTVSPLSALRHGKPLIQINSMNRERHKWSGGWFVVLRNKLCLTSTRACSCHSFKHSDSFFIKIKSHILKVI